MIWFKRILKILLGLVLTIIFFLLTLYRSDIPADEANQKYLTPESRFVEVDGIKLHVRMLGQGEPIILLHGSFSSLHTWDTWQKELSPYFLTISVDLPGHGLTGPDSQGRYSTKAYSELVVKLAEKLELDRYHLAGNSMGGGVSLQIASDHPDRVLTLNLVDSSGAPRPVSTGQNGKQASSRGGGAWVFKLLENRLISNVFLKCTPRFLFAMNMKEVYGDPTLVTEVATDRYFELMLREGNRKATLDRLRTPRDMSLDFEKLKMPTLILWGKKDTWIPVAQAYALEKAIPGSNLVIFDEAGHVPMEEIPTESVAEYLSFLGVEVRKNYLEPPKQIVYAD